MSILLLRALLVCFSQSINKELAEMHSGALDPAVARALFNVSAASVVQIDDCVVRDQFVLRVPYGDYWLELECAPRSVRAPDFTLLGTREDGSFGPLDPGPVRTFAGVVRGVPGAVVTGVGRPELGVTALIRLDEECTLELQPLRSKDASAKPGAHVLYDTRDAIDTGGTCGAATGPGGAASVGGLASGPAPCAANGPYSARLAVDTSADFISGFPGGTAAQQAAALDWIEFDLLNAEPIFLRDMNTRHELLTVVLRNESNDIYTADSYDPLLLAGFHHWRAQSPVPDLFVAYIGHPIGGSVVGAAWLASMCSPGPVIVTKRSVIVERTILLCHEIGHVWGAPHCDTPVEPPCNGDCSAGSIMFHLIIAVVNPAFAPCSVASIASRRPEFACVADPDLQRPQTEIIVPPGGVVADGAVIDLGLVPVGTTAQTHMRYTHANECNLDARHFMATQMGPPGVFQLLGGGFLTIPASGFSSGVVSFLATAPGRSAARFTMTSATTPLRSFTFQGEAILPLNVLLLGPGGGPLPDGGTVSFGTVFTGDTVDRSIRITNPNSRSVPLVISTAAAPGLTVLAGGGAVTLPAGGSHDVTYRFVSATPVQTSSQTVIALGSSHPAGAHEINLVATAVAPPPLPAPALVCPLNDSTSYQPADTVFQWLPSSTAAHYRFILATDESFQNVVYISGELPHPTATHTPPVSTAIDGTRYFWKVRAVNVHHTTDSAAATLVAYRGVIPPARYELSINGVKFLPTAADVIRELSVPAELPVTFQFTNFGPHELSGHFDLPSFLQGVSDVAAGRCASVQGEWEIPRGAASGDCEFLTLSVTGTGVSGSMATNPILIKLCQE